MRQKESDRRTGRNRIGKRTAVGFGMILWVMCIILNGANSDAEEVIDEEIILAEQEAWEENLQVSEETEEFLIENLASMEVMAAFNGHEECETTEGRKDEEEKTDGERIQDAIYSEAEVTITLSQDIILTETIRIPSGKTAALIPAEGMEVTIFRAEGFSAPMFCVEKDSLLILGREEGRILIHQGESEYPIAEGEGNLRTEGEVAVFPEPKEVFAADSLASDSMEADNAADNLTTAGTTVDNLNTTGTTADNLTTAGTAADNLNTTGTAADNLNTTGTAADNLNTESPTADNSITDDLTMDGLTGEELIEDGTMPISMDLKDAVVEWMGNTEEVYNGAAHTPEILVWAGSCLLMKGFDYDVAYHNNIHAGTAEVVITATGFGICTGSKTVTFPIRQAVLEYQVEDQKAESGVLLSDLKIPESAAGVNGEKVTGTLLWSDSEGGMALPSDMTLSGMEGETLTLYWTFYPGETFSDYLPVSGNMTITFLATKIPDNGMAGEWDGLSDGIGNLSNESSSFGTMEETEKSTETPTEKTTESPTETPTERTTESPTETPTERTTESPTETPTEKTTEKPTETSDTEKATAAGSGTAVSGGITAGSGVSTGGGSVVRAGSSGTAVSGSGSSSGISVTSGVSGKKSTPKTGDTSEIEVWILWCFLAAGVSVGVLGYRRRKGEARTRF